MSRVGGQEPKAVQGVVAKAARPSSLFPAGYADHQAITASLRRLEAEHPKAVRVRSIAKTREGRDVWIASVGRPEAKGKPAVLVVANLEADHLVGSQVALGLIERIAAADGKDAAVTKLLDERTIHVVPRLNPDGAERSFKGSPRFEFRANLTPIDRDRDGKFNEDGPNDLDGDGLALAMRVKDARAALVPDEKDPRILRKADPAKGERAVYSEIAEGIDDDGDGLLNEDPPGGVNLNRNWPRGWTEYDPETGTSPASEPEVNALIRFAFEHPEIGAVWTFGLNDNLSVEAKGIAPGDAPYYAELTRRFRKAIPKAEAPKGEPPATTDGAMSEWAYHQFGVIGLASRLWTVPDWPPGEGETRWFEWNDKVMNGRAFAPFHAVEHPTLGKVDVGGWKPGVRINPPIEGVDAIADGCFAFLKDLAGCLPALGIKETKTSAKGGGLFEVTATIENSGYLPTAIAQGMTTRKAPPVLVRLRLGTAKLLTGKALNRVDTLAGSGGTREFRWLLTAPDDVKTVVLEVSCPKAGTVRKEIPLR